MKIKINRVLLFTLLAFFLAGTGPETFGATINTEDYLVPSDGYSISFTSGKALTAPPLKPTLTLSISGTWLSLSWSSLANADGYTLFYAPSPYQGPETIGSIDMVTQTSVSFNLWEGAAYYVAVEAYNSFGGSGFSNIEHFAIADAATGRIPDTGQTTCYSGSAEMDCPQPGQEYYGQDACYTINPPSYTKLDSSGNALPSSATAWSMVRDNVTRLIWEVKTDDGSIHDRDNQYNWYEAEGVFTAALSYNLFGGYTDWRLPTIKELTYLVYYETWGLTIKRDFFPNTNGLYYWSSTPVAADSSYAWGIGFGYGYDATSNKSGTHYVRAVRGGQSSNEFVDNGNGTVTDTNTGLMWQQTKAVGRRDWLEALSYCESLTLGGYTDWHLPTIKEFKSIVDYGVFGPAINTRYFPDMVSSYTYWSSTVHAFYISSAWLIVFNDGQDYTSSKSNSFSVRAVRGGQ